MTSKSQEKTDKDDLSFKKVENPQTSLDEGMDYEIYSQEEMVEIFNFIFKTRGMCHRLAIEDGVVVHKEV